MNKGKSFDDIVSRNGNGILIMMSWETAYLVFSRRLQGRRAAKTPGASTPILSPTKIEPENGKMLFLFFSFIIAIFQDNYM